MSRARYQSRRDAAADWPGLTALLTGVATGSDGRQVERAIDSAIAGMPIKERSDLAREWCRWNTVVGMVDDIRPGVEALAVDVPVRDAAHARAFMNGIYDKLVVSVRREAGKDWKA